MSNASSSNTLTAALGLKIRDQILRGAIAPGAKLRLEELRAEFGVSSSPLREALSMLAAQGFIVGQEQRGYRPSSRAAASAHRTHRRGRRQGDASGHALRGDAADVADTKPPT